ncbi:MAG: hypothetical protein PHO27_12985 [Sulfuricurvum sp.]|jgi:hypothetical protein|nr:hypothetical protein [Sulfuricurvum sp.]
MIEFDIKALLDEYNLAYKDSGKNVSKGWINLEVCPFCNDDSYHCGIDLSSGGFHCWVCNERGFVINLLRQLEVFNGLNINRIIKDFSEGYNFLPVQEELLNLATHSLKKRVFCELPKGILDELPLPHKNYLYARNFDPGFLAKKYKLKAVYNTGDEKFRWRVIAPIFLNNKMVSFVGMSIIREKGIVKYLNCATDDSIISARDCLYNYDTIKDVAVIVEGIADVWRMGDGFVATLGKGMNSERIKLLKEKNPKKVVVLYDADAIKDAYRLANTLHGMFESVNVLELDKGDPADLSPQEAMEIRNTIWSW